MRRQRDTWWNTIWPLLHRVSEGPVFVDHMSVVEGIRFHLLLYDTGFARYRERRIRRTTGPWRFIPRHRWQSFGFYTITPRGRRALAAGPLGFRKFAQ